MKSALDAASEQTVDPSSPLYQHRIVFNRATQTKHANWLVRLSDTTSGRSICVSIAATPGAITPTTNIAFIDCGAHPVHPGTTTEPSPI